MRNVLLFLLLIAVLLAIFFWPSRAPAPDERLAAHGKAFCKIAEKGADKPRAGVERLFRYYGEQGPEMARDFAELLVLIEGIRDDRAHDERARKAARRIQAPLRGCQEALERFSRAVERDPEAKRMLERGVERLSRTLEILFGPGARTPAGLTELLALPSP